MLLMYGIFSLEKNVMNGFCFVWYVFYGNNIISNIMELM